MNNSVFIGSRKGRGAMGLMNLKVHLPPLLCVVIFHVQAQAGWLQHDFGHLSVFKNSWMNHLAHHVVQEGLKGASCYWWNVRHFQHHAKPNVVS